MEEELYEAEGIDLGHAPTPTPPHELLPPIHRYEAEGIDYGKVGFVDNSPVLGLLERKAAGLLPILDEAVVMPGGSDATFYRKLAAAHGTSPLLTMLSKGEEGERLAFEVSHYAGIVMYDHVTPYPTPRIPRSRCRTTPASSCTTPQTSATRMATRCSRISATPSSRRPRRS